jgi:hypothetical protein
MLPALSQLIGLGVSKKSYCSLGVPPWNGWPSCAKFAPVTPLPRMRIESFVVAWIVRPLMHHWPPSGRTTRSSIASQFVTTGLPAASSAPGTTLVGEAAISV